MRQKRHDLPEAHLIRKARYVMCVAVPGKIIEINGDIAKVNIMDNITQANIRLVSAKVGDYVLIHAGCVLEVLKKDTAEEILWMFSELQENTYENS